MKLKGKIQVAPDLVLGVNSELLCRWEDKQKVSIIKMDNDDFFFEISGLAADVWRRIDGRKSLRQIRDSVKKMCKLNPEDLEKEIIKFSSDLVSEGLVHAVE